jgi:hypothetical protein
LVLALLRLASRAPIERIGGAWTRIAHRLRWAVSRVRVVAAVSLAALLLGPTVWAAATVAAPGNGMVPVAGPHVTGGGMTLCVASSQCYRLPSAARGGFGGDIRSG